MRSRQAHVPGGPKCWENPTGGDAIIKMIKSTEQ